MSPLEQTARSCCIRLLASASCSSARRPRQTVGWRPTESGSLHRRPRCCRLLRYGTCQARRDNDKRSW
ncbi:hypothetical protein FLG15_16900 [Xanthomonas phaseoli pv. dieffenbachiae]